MKKKTFIITGANRGLGQSFVDALLKDADNFIISISKSKSEAQKNFSPKKFYFLEADLSDSNLYDKLDILKKIISKEEVYFINNASIVEPIIKIENISEDEIDKTLAVNIKATILITKYLLRHFNEGKLTFANISSGAANRAISNWSMYCSSKAFIQMFFKAAESEYEKHHFFNIDPGVMDTNMQASIRASDFPDVASFQNLKTEEKLKSTDKVALEILNTIL